MIEETLKTVLETSGKKAYALIKPEKATLPCITYRRIATYHHRNVNSPSSLNRILFQIDVWGSDYNSTRTLANSLVTILEANDTSWEVSTVENEMDFRDEESGLYRVLIEVYLWNK
jgi:hypothetical protein